MSQLVRQVTRDDKVPDPGEELRVGHRFAPSSSKSITTASRFLPAEIPWRSTARPCSKLIASPWHATSRRVGA